jgi:hypothetical protein
LTGWSDGRDVETGCAEACRAGCGDGAGMNGGSLRGEIADNGGTALAKTSALKASVEPVARSSLFI